MSKPRVVRTNSTPLLIPNKRRSELSKRKTSVGTPTKSILIKRDSSNASSPVQSNGSSPYGTPEIKSGSFPKRKISQVRFSEGNIESPDYYLYNKGKAGEAIVNPMSVYRKISTEKAVVINQQETDNDSVTGLEGSDDDSYDDDDDFDINDNSSTRSNSPPPRLSSSMSTEAQYAILKAYEDEMYSKIAKTFPEVSKRLQSHRCQTPDVRNHHDDIDDILDIDDLDDSSSIVSHTETPCKVAQRIQKAMDILDSVRESNGELVTSNKFCSNRTIAKNPVRSFERWCDSLKDALEDIK